jgi:hypothetical protein
MRGKAMEMIALSMIVLLAVGAWTTQRGIPYGKGRVYTTMLGHLWKDKPDTAMRCAGFQTMLLRGTERAAAGEVTIPISEDFPSADQIQLLPSTQP